MEVKEVMNINSEAKGDLSIKICLSTRGLCSCRKDSLSFFSPVKPHHTSL